MSRETARQRLINQLASMIRPSRNLVRSIVRAPRSMSPLRPASMALSRGSGLLKREACLQRVAVTERRWASTAAAEKEAEEEASEPVWPERVLPVMASADKLRLARQRNVGM
jgi:hypothetical protein